MGWLRIFIACTDERLRLALLMLLDSQPGMTVVGISDRLTGLLAQLEGAEPDVLVLDWDQPAGSTADLMHDLQDLECQPITIGLSTKPQNKKRILATGADYFISKDAPPDELLKTLNGIRLSKSDTGPS